jgi:deoxyribonuclease-4
MKEHNMDLEKVIIHAPYIVNLGNLENFDFSVAFLKEEVRRASQLGIKNIVLHPGASVSYTKEESIQSIIDGLNLILDNNLDVTICLETMAGKGTEIGSNIEEIKTIINGVKFKNKIGVCLDTCHISDSGIDISKFDEYLDYFNGHGLKNKDKQNEPVPIAARLETGRKKVKIISQEAQRHGYGHHRRINVY